VAGDAFVAGGEVRLRGKVHGDAVLAGGEVTVEDDIADDLYAAGGTVRIASTVRENARLAGGRVIIAPTGSVLGRASIAGARVEVAGHVGGALSVYADRVRVDGEVGGDLLVVARALSVGPRAQIGGRLTYRGPKPADISPSAVIAGGVEFERRAAHDRLFGPIARTAARVGAILLVLSMLVVGAVLVFAAPRFSAQAADNIVRRPGRVLAVGLTLLVAVPAAALVAIITVVGIPLGLLLLLCYPVVLLLGGLTAGLCLGDRIVRLLPRGRGDPLGKGWRLAGLALALALIALLASLPFAGWGLLLGAVALGVGGLALRSWQTLAGTHHAMPPASLQPQGD
jgi:cytoskeletal protein CcmA (bactofilin family)